MQDAENGETFNTYDVAMYGTADEITAGIANGTIDIANVPCNLASVLYNKTEGAISVAAINTLGVLYVVETGDTIQSVEDLRGKTIYSTGKGTTPEYALNYILNANGIDPEKDVTIEYKSESTEVAAVLADAEDAIAVLPQPFVTTAMMQNENLRIALSLTDEWDAVQGEGGSTLVTGVTIVRNAVLEENPQAFAEFMKEYEASIAYTETNPEEAAALIAGYEIVPKEPVALKALPYCNIRFVAGDEMKAKVSGYLEVLFDADPKSVGGTLPDDASLLCGLSGEKSKNSGPQPPFCGGFFGFSCGTRRARRSAPRSFWCRRSAFCARSSRWSLTRAFSRRSSYSAVRIIGGFFIAMALGVVLGWVSSRFWVVETLLRPVTAVIKATPVASFIILVLLWFSSRNLSVIISVLMVFPVIYTNTLEGIQSADPKLLEMAKVFRMSAPRRLLYIYLPAVIPFFVSACSVSLGLCWKSGIAAEVIGIPDGSIGELLYNAKNLPANWRAARVDGCDRRGERAFEKLFMLLLRTAVKKLGMGGALRGKG